MAARRTTGKCTACGERPIDKTNIGPEMCRECNEYYEWENEHIDRGHEDDGADLALSNGCPHCYPELDPRDVERTPGHTNTVARSHNSHTGHHHPRTPRHRAACRKSLATTGKPLDVRPSK